MAAQLLQKDQQIARILARAGVRTRRLASAEIEELFYYSYDSSMARLQKMRAKSAPVRRVTVRALTVRLSDPEWTVRRQAALALGRIGKAAQAAIPALEELAEDSDQLMRKAAEEALANVRK